MSDPPGVTIAFDIPFSVEAIRTALTTISGAVADNWALSDEWSSVEPEYPVHVEEWASKCAQGAEDGLYGEVFDGEWNSEEFAFSFSPLSGTACGLTIYRTREGKLSLLLLLSEHNLYEIEGARELERMDVHVRILKQTGAARQDACLPFNTQPDSDAWNEKECRLWDTPNVWPKNRQCMRHIISKLGAVFPIRETHMDEPLQDSADAAPAHS